MKIFLEPAREAPDRPSFPLRGRIFGLRENLEAFLKKSLFIFKSTT